MSSKTVMKLSRLAMAAGFAVTTAMTAIVPQAIADETCMSPYMAKIVGQEDFVYIWTLGIDGLGDGQDKLVTVEAQKLVGISLEGSVG